MRIEIFVFPGSSFTTAPRFAREKSLFAFQAEISRMTSGSR